jgi:tetratricopeptide (TPR) repeat protein
LIGLGIDVQASRSKILISDRPIFDAIWLGLAAVLLHGLVDATQFIEFLSLPPLFILMGLTTRLCRHTPQVQPRNRSLYGIGVSGVMALLVVGLIGWKSLAADFYVNKAALTLIDVALAPELTEVEQAQRQDQARLDLQQALRYQPAHSGAQRWLGLIEYRQENFEAAIPYFRAALPIEADNYTIWKGLGYAYLWSGDVVTAKFFLKRVPESYSELGSYAQWWKSRGYPDRSDDASELRQLLTD